MSTMTLKPPSGCSPAGRCRARSDLAGHLATHGPLAIPARDDPRWRAAVVRAVAESGLLGRGGAGFPAAAKWDAVRATARRPLRGGQRHGGRAGQRQGPGAAGLRSPTWCWTAPRWPPP